MEHVEMCLRSTEVVSDADGTFVKPEERCDVLDTHILSMGHVGMCLTSTGVVSEAEARWLDQRQGGMCLTRTF